MKKQTQFILMAGSIFVVLIFFSGLFTSEPKEKPLSPTKVMASLEYLRSSLQKENKMDLYALKSEYDVLEFVDICRQKKAVSTYKFYYIVIFDKAENAEFPSDPFTARYGLEESKLRHIKAIYEFNRINGFSEITVWDTNAWEGKPSTGKI